MSYDRQQGAATVIFDCDSTLSAMEGIDELAEGHRDRIRELTDAAMDGSIALEKVYGQRLDIIRPTRERLEAIGRLYVERLVPDAREVVGALLHLGKDVRVISGGLLPPVAALAADLGIPLDRVRAVDIEFGADGGFVGFEESSPLCRDGGKPEVIRDWAIDRPAIMVGDGNTDLETRDEVDLFVAFAGVVRREAVVAGADVVLTAPTLAPVLALAAGTADREALKNTQWEPLLRRGSEMLLDSQDVQQ